MRQDKTDKSERDYETEQRLADAAPGDTPAPAPGAVQPAEQTSDDQARDANKR
jgi:hypothetical protein